MSRVVPLLEKNGKDDMSLYYRLACKINVMVEAISIPV